MRNVCLGVTRLATKPGGLAGPLGCSDGGSRPARVVEVQVAPFPAASNAEGFVWVFDPVTDPDTWLPGRP